MGSLNLQKKGIQMVNALPTLIATSVFLSVFALPASAEVQTNIRVQNALYIDRCLEVSQIDGEAKARLEPCNASSEQLWTLDTKGKGPIMNTVTGLCLALNTDAHGDIKIQTCELATNWSSIFTYNSMHFLKSNDTCLRGGRFQDLEVVMDLSCDVRDLTGQWRFLAD